MEKKNKVFICAGDKKGYHYFFVCPKCRTELELITGPGRYGNLGPFECPVCNAEYYATIDDHQNPCLYVANRGEQPGSLLDCDGRKRCIKLPYEGN